MVEQLDGDSRSRSQRRLNVREFRRPGRSFQPSDTDQIGRWRRDRGPNSAMINVTCNSFQRCLAKKKYRRHFVKGRRSRVARVNSRNRSRQGGVSLSWRCRDRGDLRQIPPRYHGKQRDDERGRLSQQSLIQPGIANTVGKSRSRPMR